MDLKYVLKSGLQVKGPSAKDHMEFPQCTLKQNCQTLIFILWAYAHKIKKKSLKFNASIQIM